jgi:uncharacterized membrane-anchored protein YitT (DUF2179 family)
MNKNMIKSEVKDYLGITLALILYSFGFTFFLMPYEIVTGGVAGIAAIVYYATGFPNSYTYFLINAALLGMALKILGVKFLMKTIFATLMLSFLLWFMKDIAPVDENGQMIKILGEGQDFMSLMIGCLMTGSALGLTFLFNGSTGGTDIIAASINKYRDISLGTILIFVDFLIIGSCLFVPQFGTFLQRMTMVTFGFCTMIIENFMLDYIMNRQRQSVQFMIFSKHHEDIARAISEQTDHTMTILDGSGWYSGKEMKVIVLLAKKSESVMIFRIIKMIDPKAFVSQSAVIGVYGEGFDKIKIKVNG